MRRIGPVAVLGCLAVVAAPGGSAPASPEARAAPGAAHVWIDTDGGRCSRSSPPAPYSDGSACGTLQAAADAARSGDVVAIVDGIYGGQTLAEGTKRITFQAAGPGRPRFGQIVSAASNVVLRSIQIENRDHRDGPCPDPDNAVLYPCGTNQVFDDVVVDGLDAATNTHGIRGVGAGFVLRNSEVRNVVNQKGFEGGADDMVVENTSWHGIRVTDPQVHNECMYVDGGNRAVIRGNRFLGCPTMALYLTNWNGGPPYRDVLIENNVFAHTVDSSGNWHSAPCGLVLGSGANNQNTYVGWVVRHNTFESCVGVGSTPAAEDDGSGEWYGNLGTVGRCIPEFRYHHNVGETCGGVGDVAVRPAINTAERPSQAPFYVDAENGDFRLRPGTRAVNRGDRARHPVRDHDGKRRPVGSAPDAGAYEYGWERRTAALAVGGLDAGDARIATTLKKFERRNAADLLLLLGDNDATAGRAFPSSWRAQFGWLRGSGVRVAGALGEGDVRVRRGRHQFAPLGMRGAYYVRRTRELEVIVLDSTSVTAAQTRWLTGVLARRTGLFRVVVVHHPPFSCGGSSGSEAVRTRWVPLFERHGVRLVLSGHERSYQRFVARGVTYVVSSLRKGRPGRLRACPGSHPRRAVAKSRSGFVYLRIDRNGVVGRALDASGRIVDRFRAA